MLRAITTILTLSVVGAAHAQMPVPLLDNEPAAPNAAPWAVAGPMFQTALECREDLPDHPATCAQLPRKPAGEEQALPADTAERIPRLRPAGGRD